MTMGKAEPTISELKSLGPKSQEMLARVGITTVQQLEEMGAVAAYAMVKRANPNASLNLLWGLESALTGMPWPEVARTQRVRLLQALADYEFDDGTVAVNGAGM